MTRIILIVLCVFTLTSCGSNILSEFTSETDESRLFEATQLMNKKKWSAAIAKFSEMSASFLAKREVKLKQAKAYVGRCGLNFLQFADDLSNIGSTSLFTLLYQSMQGATATETADCIQAETLIKSIGATGAQRTEDENISMAFVAFAKIGAILASRANFDGTGGLDWGHNDSCTDGTGNDEYMTDVEVQHIATGIAIALDAITNTSSDIGSGPVDDINNVCGTVTVCTDMNISDVDALEIAAARSLVQEGADGIGLGTCTAGTPNVVNCVCPP